jgi:hypothetical protein
VRGTDLRVEAVAVRQAQRQDCEIRRGIGDMVSGDEQVGTDDDGSLLLVLAISIATNVSKS